MTSPGGALLALVRERDAIVFAEATTILNQDREWLRARVPEFPYPRFDVHVVRRARRTLLALGELEELGTTFPSGREVKALVYGPDYRGRGRRTQVMAAVRRKRRIYHTYLSWTHNTALCGRVAERVVLASMRAADGLYGVPATSGNVREIEGQRLPDDKTLDAAAHAIIDLERPSRALSTPLIPIGVEVKNVRQPLYPSSTEVWDLLSKLAEFPDVVPVLVCRLAHFTLFRMFADLGAAAHYTQTQYFSADIPTDRFRSVISELGFRDARQMADPDRRQPAITGFFSKSLRAPRVEEPADDRPLLVRAQERWAKASAIVAGYSELSEPLADDDDRGALFLQFRTEVDAAGLRTVGGW